MMGEWRPLMTQFPAGTSREIGSTIAAAPPRAPAPLLKPPDNGFCESVLFWHIQRGHYGDINLDGLSFVRVGKWEGDLWAGKAKGSAGIFIDERADERQAEVLPRIFGGQVGGFPALVAALFAE